MRVDSATFDIYRLRICDDVISRYVRILIALLCERFDISHDIRRRIAARHTNERQFIQSRCECLFITDTREGANLCCDLRFNARDHRISRGPSRALSFASFTTRQPCSISVNSSHALLSFQTD